MVTFNEAMLSTDRTLAIRVGDYTSENIKDANFKYGYISGEDFTPGGTYSSSAAITFTSIIETFKKLDVISPEIGLLVDDAFEWVKMGKYYIDDIKIDRNSNTTQLELMDGMFKLNEPFKTDLKYPAQLRDVIKEIAIKTGVTLASDNFGIVAIQQHVDKPTGDKLTFRDVLSQVSQLLGFSCFFNRVGNLEVRGLTESGITITADNYFLHGLERSEVEYQIAGITCQTANDEKLTVGLQTGRSLELENPLATQELLDALYYDLRTLRYYPFDLSYQGHLKLDVGQWVTIKTNKNEVFKVPVLYQSFSFSGGLTSTISADSVSGNDAQYTYGSFLTKRINQQSTQIQAEVQQQLQYINDEFDRKQAEAQVEAQVYQETINQQIADSKTEIESQISDAKNQAEINARAYADEINQATAEVARLAQNAAESFNSDLAEVTKIANQAQADAISLTTQLNTAKSSLQNQINKAKSDLQASVATVDVKAEQAQADVNQTKQDLQSQANQLNAQATKQEELTKLTADTKKLVDGQITTISELSKTVAQNGKDIASVQSRTKTVEDTLTGTKTILEQVKATAESTSRKTTEIESGISGLNSKFENLQIGSTNLLRNTATLPIGNRSKGEWEIVSGGNGTAQIFDLTDSPSPLVTKGARIINNTSGNKDISQFVTLKVGESYTISAWARVAETSEIDNPILLMRAWDTNDNNKRLSVRITNTDWQRYSVTFVAEAETTAIEFGQTNNGNIEICGPQIEQATVRSDYKTSELDLSQSLATYQQSAERNLADLQSTIQTLDGRVTSNKSSYDQDASKIATRLSSLETYKNAEGTRESKYFEAAKAETAKQLAAERTAIAKDYVAKSTYTSDVTGIRNDLTATTTTANTTKTNLANYQISNDKAVANLKSSLQNADGKISSLQTSLNAVPGQISAAVSAVETKIPTSIGGRNYIRNYGTIFNPSNLHTSSWRFETVDDPDAKSGKAVKATCTAAGSNGFHKVLYDLRGDSFDGRQMTYAVDIKVSKAVKLRIGAEIFQGGYKTLDATTSWQRFIHTGIVKLNRYYSFPVYIDRGSWSVGDVIWLRDPQLEDGSIATTAGPATEDIASDITQAKAEIKVNSDEIAKRLTKTEVQTVVTGYGYQTKAQVDSNITGRGYITSSALQPYATTSVLENKVKETASSFERQITETKSLIPASMSQRNLATGTSGSWNSYLDITSNNNWCKDLGEIRYGDATGIYANSKVNVYVYISADNIVLDDSISNKRMILQGEILTSSGSWTWDNWTKYNPIHNKWTTTLKAGNNYHIIKVTGQVTADAYSNSKGFRIQIRIDGVKSGKFHWRALMVTTGDIFTDYWTPAFEDLTTVTAFNKVKDTVDEHKRTLASKLDATELSIRSDGFVVKSGKSTTDLANAMGSYFSVNQSAINLFSDKINVKGSMIVNGAITADKIASKAITTSHLNGKIITADVIASNAITSDAIKAGAITTAKMAANSINGDRITAGTLDAGKIKTGSITSSQIASSTITSTQIKASTILGSNIAANTITANNIVVNQALFDKLTANNAYLKQLFANDAFIAQVKATTLSASKITGGVLDSTNNKLQFNLDTGVIKTKDSISETMISTQNNQVFKIDYKNTYSGGVTASLSFDYSGAYLKHDGDILLRNKKGMSLSFDDTNNDVKLSNLAGGVYLGAGSNGKGTVGLVYNRTSSSTSYYDLVEVIPKLVADYNKRGAGTIYNKNVSWLYG